MKRETDPAAEKAMSLFDSLGYTTQRVPTAETKRADFWAISDNERVLVEVKTRQPSKEIGSQPGVTVSTTAPQSLIRPKSLHKAQEQIAETPDANDASHCGMVLFCDSIASFWPVIYVLYGYRSVCLVDKDRTSTVNVLYIGNAKFQKKTSLDWVLSITPKGEGRLFVNPDSTKRQSLSGSMLYTIMADSDAVFDPAEDRWSGCDPFHTVSSETVSSGSNEEERARTVASQAGFSRFQIMPMEHVEAIYPLLT